MEWKSELPTEPGYYWASRVAPGQYVTMLFFDQDSFWSLKFNLGQLIKTPNKFKLNEHSPKFTWFKGPLPGPLTFTDSLDMDNPMDNLAIKHRLAAEVYSATNRLNEAIKRCGETGLDVDIDNAEWELPDGRKIPHLIAKVSLELSGEMK